MQDMDEIFMRRAMELATNGLGNVRPNPLVGCVIVLNEKIIGEGWHEVYGGPHAEVKAVESVQDKALLRESTIYVNLEPCAHFGKTPPCADLLVNCQVKKVVIANVDSNPLVGGKGIAKLKDVGIEVVTGVREEQGRELNKRFFTFMEKNLPFIILKWAQTADGFLGRVNFDSKWISNELSRKLVHKWRSEEAGIMVGPNTAKYDNPRLNVREWSGNDPVRIVVDRNLRLDKKLFLFDKSQATICYNLIKDSEEENLIYKKVNEANFFLELFQDLYERKIQSIIVEGGAMLLNYFIQNDLWDEARVFYSDVNFGDGIAAPLINGKILREERVLNDKLIYYKNVGDVKM
jgi:diaminohydroxyphosphoribosylaminopyrimidine deaminase / 5-amino-6-(5-phosphoribosylamino)uracil reductase